jgi:23S rRNA pseudouridine2605 synthase
LTGERLQKVLARAGVASRRRAEDLIREGKVTINGQVAEIGQRVDPATDAIKVEGRRVRPRQPRTYLLLNKPPGYITAKSDPQQRPTVFDLVPPGRRKGLLAVGRLDYQSEGLLILTDDGEFAQRVAHPRYGCTKAYAVKVRGTPEPAELDKLRQGIVLAGRRTAPAAVKLRKPADERRGIKNSWWTVELSEGRTRQIREMFFRIGHPVQRLRRVAIGPLTDRGLPVGGLRELEEGELDQLAGRRPVRRPAKRGRRAAGKTRPKEGDR